MTPPELGRYRLEQQVGQGGMAVVWRGFDTQLRRTVAVKILHPHLHTRAEIRRRFDREAHAVARLHHPHILDVYDFSGPDAEPSYLVTEFIPGQSLRAFADAHPFDPPELAACCAVPLCEALEHAHAAGVVHRDVKPENVMVRDDGQIKLTDFGIAALLDPDEKFTVTGSILGSPAHLAPETIEGKPADTRSDLFSLGTLLYWLACGKLPFHAQSPAALLRQILEGTPQDPRLARRSVSDGLAKVITRLLERDPDKRYQTAAAVKTELVALLADAGLEDPHAELRAFVTGTPPEKAAEALRGRLVAHQLARGEDALRGKRTSLALSAFGRVLALAPDHAEARSCVDRIRKRARSFKLIRRAAGVAALSTGLAWGGTAAMRTLRAPLVEAPLPLPTAVATRTETAPDPGQRDPRPETRTPGLETRPTGVETRAPKPEPAADASRHRPRGDQRPPRLAGVGSVHATLNVHWVSARVFVDGEDLGLNKTFAHDLTIGPHKVTVSHECCVDRIATLDVTADQTRYALEPGSPKPARLSVQGAPPDARVLIDGVLVGAVGTLAEREFSTDPRPMREVQLSVGDRGGTVTLQAGRTVSVDFLKLRQGGP